ncbi:31818_t:CDS:1, partial [Racocetra persica]
DIEDKDNEFEKKIEDDFEEEELEKQLYTMTIFSKEENLGEIHNKLDLE